MAYKNKQFFHKVYDSSGTTLKAVWSSDVTNVPSFKMIINSGQGEMKVRLARSLDDFGENVDVKFGNQIRTYILDKESSTTPLLVYSGYISDYQPTLTEDDHYIEVVALGYVVTLENTMLIDSTGNTAKIYLADSLLNAVNDSTNTWVLKNSAYFPTSYPYYLLCDAEYAKVTNNNIVASTLTVTRGEAGSTPASHLANASVGWDPATILSDLITLYNASYAETGAMVLEGLLYSTGYIRDYNFNNITNQQAIDKIREISPNGYYWFVGADKLLNFNSKAITAKHIFTIGTNATKLEAFKTMRDLKNAVRFIGGVPAPETISGVYTVYPQLYKTQEDPTSVGLYGRKEYVMIDTSVINSNTADAMIQNYLDGNKNPFVRATITIIDSNGDDQPGYDIETIKPGDTCVIKDPLHLSSGLSYGLDQVMVIQTVQYDYDTATLELSVRMPWVAKRIQDIYKDLTRSVITASPTYPIGIVGSQLPPVFGNIAYGSPSQPGIVSAYDSGGHLTIKEGILQTAETGYRMKMYTDNADPTFEHGHLDFFSDNTSFGGLEIYRRDVGGTILFGFDLGFSGGQFRGYGNASQGTLNLELHDPSSPSDQAGMNIVWSPSFSGVAMVLWKTIGGVTTDLPINSNIYPYGSHEIGSASNRWTNIYGTNIYCTNQTVGKTITGDLLFRHKGEIVFRIDENPEFLNFYNKQGRLIMKLGEDGTIYAKDIKRL